MENLLKQYRVGLGLLVVGIAAFFIVQGNPFNDLQLLNGGVSVKGVATDVNDFEDREDNGNLTRYFFIKYEFTTISGEKISDVVEVPGNSADKGFRTGQSLDIKYVSNKPGIHQILALTSTTLSGWILKNLLFGLLAIVPGLYFLYRSYTEKK